MSAAIFWASLRYRSLRLGALLIAVLIFTSSAVISKTPALTRADRAVIPALLHADSALKDFAIVARRQVSDQLDLVLALGSPNPNQVMYDGAYTWQKEDRLGIFLQDRHDANHVFTLTIEPGPPCQIHLERVTARDVLISCPGDYDWGAGANNQKFVFDLNTKRMVQRYAYRPFTNYVLVQTADRLYFVAGDLHHIIAAVWDAQAASFRLLPEAQTPPILEKISIQTGSMSGDEYRVPVLPSERHVAFGSGKRFELVGIGKDYPVIVEHRQHTPQEFPLPQSSQREWAIKRSEEAKDIFPASALEVREQIGPYQVDGDRLWFGKTFYNGEGITGVGGFGYFDANSRSYTLYAPSEIWKWSVSALLLEPDAAWLGLAHYGEGWGMSGGLLRWDRATKSVRHFDLKATLYRIVRRQDGLYLATDGGIEVLRGEQVDRYIVDAPPNRRFQVVACDGGYR